MASVTTSQTLGWLVKSRRETELAIADHNAWLGTLGPQFWQAHRVSVMLGRRHPVEYVGPRDIVTIVDGVVVGRRDP